MNSEPLNTKRKWLEYVNIFRGIAILFIVTGHTLYFELENMPLFLRSLLGTVFVNGTFYFVFIAGFLFQYLSGNFSYKKFYRSKLINVVSPYIVAVFLFVLGKMLSHGTFSMMGFLKQFVFDLVNGSASTPLWYIPMITIFYLLTPFFLWFDRHEHYAWLLPLAILTILFPRGSHTQLWQNVLYFFPIYLFGMYAAHYHERFQLFLSNKKMQLSLLLLFFITVEVFLSSKLIPEKALTNSPAKINILFSFCASELNMTIIRLLFCLFFMAVLYHNESNIVQSKFGQFLQVTAKYSFGIFFYHNALIGAASMLIRNLFGVSPYPVWVMLLFYLLSPFLISITLICILKLIQHSTLKLGIHKTRFLIGC